MDDRDFWGIMILIAGLTAVMQLQSRKIAVLTTDVRYLMDNAVTHETEAPRA